MKRAGVVRGLIVACLLGSAISPIVSLIVAVPAGQVAQRVETDVPSKLNLAVTQSGPQGELEHSAARHTGSDDNVVVVAKAIEPGVPLNGLSADSLAPQDVPKASATDDASLKTGSIQAQHLPLLPPVPGPDAFKVHKSDRLGVPQRSDASHIAPGSTDSVPDAGVAPHAELAPTKTNGIALAAAKSAMLLPAHRGRSKPLVTGSIAMKPMNLAPEEQDSLFQGPPAPPADPAVDPDAPVLGYAEQMASAEAPFKSLFAVSAVAKHAWLAVDNSLPPDAAKAKPTKLAHLVPPHRHARKHQAD